MKKIILFVIAIVTTTNIAFASKPIYLWEGIKGMEKEKTRLYVYETPDSLRNGISVIICPGGSYHHLGLQHEGYDVAKWLTSQGITAFVLRYRVGMRGYHHPAMIEDLQRTIQFVRENAHSYGINVNKLGVMGFSAGGHLVIMAGVFHQTSYLKKVGINTDISLRPDFIVPIYPVVSMQDSLAHIRSRKNLLGKNYTKAMMDTFSMELQIPNDMPPVFLVTAKNDPVVKYQNSVELDKALTNKNIKHHFLLYETGGHGYGLSEKRGGEAANWKITFKECLNNNFTK